MVARTHAVNTRMEKKNNGEIDLEETWRTAADRATSSSFKLESDVTEKRKRQDNKVRAERVSLILGSVQLWSHRRVYHRKIGGWWRSWESRRRTEEERKNRTRT